LIFLFPIVYGDKFPSLRADNTNGGVVLNGQGTDIKPVPKEVKFSKMVDSVLPPGSHCKPLLVKRVEENLSNIDSELCDLLLTVELEKLFGENISLRDLVGLAYRKGVRCVAPGSGFVEFVCQ
ncbi:MAG: hypothetical protein V3R73_05635, partial [Sphingomonadales bacterium]